MSTTDVSSSSSNSSQIVSPCHLISRSKFLNCNVFFANFSQLDNALGLYFQCQTVGISLFLDKSAMQILPISHHPVSIAKGELRSIIFDMQL